MRSLALIVVVFAACATTPPTKEVLVLPPKQLSLDITVSHERVSVFTSSTDTECTNTFTFPQVGESAVWGDVGCGGSCLTRLAVVTDDATTEQPAAGWGPTTFDVDVSSRPEAVLELEGCGGSASIPIGGLAMPTAFVRATFDATRSSVTASWSGDGGRSALLWFNAGFWSDLRHTAAHDYTFVSPFNTQAVMWVSADVFRSMSPIGTDYGIVRVWSVESAFAMVETRASAREAAQETPRAK